MTRVAYLNPQTGNMWVPVEEDWDVWNADSFEITYESIPEYRKA